MKKILLFALIGLILAGCSTPMGFGSYKESKIKEHNLNEEMEFKSHSKIKEITTSPEDIENLVLLGKIWGFLKYYHPNVRDGQFNWDYELFRILPKVLEANNSIDRDYALASWIEGLGDFEVSSEEQEISGDIKLHPDLEWITNSILSEELEEQLLKVKNSKRTNKSHYVELGMSDVTEIKNEDDYSSMLYPDTGYRLLALYRYWNIVEYYFPYKYLIEEDWTDVLKEFIPKMISAPSKLEYNLTLMELIARIHDTHAYIEQKDANSVLSVYWGRYTAPLGIRFIEDQAVVSGYTNIALGEESGMKAGDIITKINEKTVKEIVEERWKYTSASNDSTKLSEIAAMLFRTNSPQLNIEYIRDDKVYKSQIKTVRVGNVSTGSLTGNTHFKMLKEDIAYVYVGLMRNQHIPQVIREVKDTKGLVIDLRSFPIENIGHSLGAFLLPKPTEFSRLSHASIVKPGYFIMDKPIIVGIKNDEYYKGKVIILVNESTISQAEYTAMVFRRAPKATVIGSTTAGADGNKLKIPLPGGITTYISGIGVYYPDGTETQRVGIVPDIVVNPTIEGLKLGKDELLEKAIEIIKED